MLRAFPLLPVVVPVVVPIVRTAVIGVRSRSVVVGGAVIITVTRPVVIRVRRGNGARGQRAGGQAKRQTRTYPASLRRSRHAKLVAPTAATVAKTANVFFMRMSSFLPINATTC